MEKRIIKAIIAERQKGLNIEAIPVWKWFI